MRTIAPAAPGKLEHLESVRGLAAAAVVACHLALAFGPGWVPAGEPPWPLVQRLHLGAALNGRFPVLVFFVLSGFVLSYSYFRNPTADRLAAAAGRRYLRLAIPAGASVLLGYALIRLHLIFNHEAAAVRVLPVGLGGVRSEWLTAFYNLTPSFRFALRTAAYRMFFDPSFGAFNNALWTMGVELRGSFFVYAFCAFFGGSRNRPAIYAIVGGGCLLLGEPYLPDFLAGVALCDAYVTCSTRPGGGRLGWPVAVALAVLGVYLGSNVDDPGWARRLPWALRGVEVWRSAGAVAVVAAAAFGPSLHRPLRWRPFVYLGRVSFALYLVHIPVIFSLGCYVFWQARAHGAAQPAAALAASAASAVASLALAELGTRYVDQPAIRFAGWTYDRAFRSARTR